MSDASSPISVVVMMEVEPGRRDEVEQHIGRFCDEIASRDPGTETYILVRPGGPDAENTLAMYEEFRDEAAMVVHGEMAAVLSATLQPLLRNVTVLVGTAVRRASQRADR